MLEQKMKHDAIKNLFFEIQQFFNISKEMESIIVHLLFSPSTERTPSGGANLGKKDITLEIPTYALKDWNIEYAYAILAHETAHTYYDRSHISHYVEKVVQQKNIKGIFEGRSAKEFLKESIISACAPHGYFCQKYFKIYEPLQDMLLPSLEKEKALLVISQRFMTWHLYPIVGQYTFQKKPIDKKFVEIAAKYLQK